MSSIPHVKCLKTLIEQHWYPMAILPSFWTSTGGCQGFMKSLRIYFKLVICLEQSLWGDTTILIKSVSIMAMKRTWKVITNHLSLKYNMTYIEWKVLQTWHQSTYAHIWGFRNSSFSEYHQVFLIHVKMTRSVIKW